MEIPRDDLFRFFKFNLEQIVLKSLQTFGIQLEKQYKMFKLIHSPSAVEDGKVRRLDKRRPGYGKVSIGFIEYRKV